MMKVYILTRNGDEVGDLQMTMDFKTAIDWLTKRNNPICSVLEYHLGETGIEASWRVLWYISQDGEVTYMNY